jgi:Bacterial regulatory proteins, lacI family
MQQRNQGKGSAPWHYNEMMNFALSGRNVQSCTVIDIARLAGVSTATVSRVVNGSRTVSCTTQTKVWNAISGLRYCPNTHAAQLGRQNRGIPRKRGVCVPALPDTTVKGASDPGVGDLSGRCTAGQLHLLEDENSRLRRLVADLTFDLEMLKRAPSSADQP